ncbi:MAG: shikimate dehydrogenase [Candidatus Accumulibacter sp.]|jgi:shikimate dehydrogenase|nr:shikimate dehydrogenase [Accumulibacter sp.]
MTDRYAVIGNPVAHSKSPALQTAFARQCGHTIDYVKIAAPLDGFVETVRRFRDDGGKGANITIPFKMQAFALADELTPRAKAAGAVNSFSFRDDASILGDNTDGVGLVRDIVCNQNVPIRGARILLLGAGGAVRGALGALLAEKPASIFLANRTPSKAVSLAEEFGKSAPSARATTVAGGGFAEAKGGFNLIINATASSIAGETPPIPEECWQGAALAYDLFYQQDATPFLCAAQAAGVKQAVDGLGMVVEQGAECFFLWRGVRPETAPVIAMLR